MYSLYAIQTVINYKLIINYKLPYNNIFDTFAVKGTWDITYIIIIIIYYYSNIITIAW